MIPKRSFQKYKNMIPEKTFLEYANFLNIIKAIQEV